MPPRLAVIQRCLRVSYVQQIRMCARRCVNLMPPYPVPPYSWSPLTQACAADGTTASRNPISRLVDSLMEGSAGGSGGQMKGPSRRAFGPQQQQQQQVGRPMVHGPPGAAAAAAHAHAQAHAQAQGMMGPMMGPHGNGSHPQQV